MADSFGNSYPSRFGIRRVRARHLPLYREFYGTATFQTVSGSLAFPLFLRSNHGIAEIDGRLFLFRRREREGRARLNIVGLPIDRAGAPMDVAAALDILAEINGGTEGRIELVHPGLPATGAPRRPRPMANRGTEYVYDNAALAGLEGHTFKNIRRALSRFERTYRVEIVPYEPALRPAAEQVYARWADSAGAKYGSIWDRGLVRRIFASYQDLEGYEMFLVRDLDREEYVGFFDAFRMSPTFAIAILRKVDTSYESMARYCQIWLSRHLAARGCRYLNDGDDAGGHAGLAGFKSSLHPVATFTPVSYRARAATRATA